jgi:nucleoid-associated protein EbfC
MQTIDQEEMAMLKGGLGGLMKQAQKMQEDMQKVQAELANMEVDGQAGGGLVRVVMTGKHEVRRVSIDPSLFEDDRDMIEDLVAAAVNDAVHKAEAAAQERMSGLTAGMGLPAGMKLPF